MRIFGAAVSLLLAAGCATTTASAQSFVGTWTATAQLGPDIRTSETLTVVKTDNGYSVTGKAIDAPAGSPEAGPGTDVVLEGDKFSYKRSLLIGEGTALVVSYAGTVSGDIFTGTAELGGTEIPYNGVRSAAGK